MRRAIHVILPLLLGALLGACVSTPPTSFYALSSSMVEPPARPSPLLIAVGPVDLPRYLERPQIVSRSSDNRLKVDEFNRWGGALEEEIVRVLGDQLGRRLGTQRIYNYPSRIAAETDYRVALDIRTFDGSLGGGVVLDVTWSLIDDRSGEAVLVRQQRYPAQAASPGYEAYAAAMSDALAQLGSDIATVLAARPRP